MQDTGFCTLCGFKIESFGDLTACPRCASKSVPCSNNDQVNISINIHELKILCMWAENWTKYAKIESDVVYAIALRIKKQLSKPTILTMADEFQALKDAGFNFETNHPSADDI